MIERDIPGIGSSSNADLAAAATGSNAVLEQMNAEDKNIRWEQSYVAGDKTFCVYQAADISLIKEHSERSGFPATIITEISNQIDPSTADD